MFSLTSLPEGAPRHCEGELPVVAGLAGYLATTAAILVPVLALRRLRPTPPPGVVTATVAAVALQGSVLTEFRYVVPAVGAIVGAVLVELSRPWWPAGQDPWLVLGFGLPPAVWAGQLVGLAMVERVAWSVELWAGLVLLTGLAGGALALLTGPKAPATEAPNARPTAPPTQTRSPGAPVAGAR